MKFLILFVLCFSTLAQATTSYFKGDSLYVDDKQFASTSPSASNVWTYDGAKWINNTLINTLGFTPANATSLADYLPLISLGNITASGNISVSGGTSSSASGSVAISMSTTPTFLDTLITGLSSNLIGSNQSVSAQIVALDNEVKFRGDSGFFDNAKPSLAYDASTQKLTVSGVRKFYNQGKYFENSTTESATHAATVGTHYFYYDNNGALKSKTAVYDLSTDTPVAYVKYESVAKNIVFDERHGAQNFRDHIFGHFTNGAFTVGSIGALNGTYDIATGTGANVNYGVDGLTISDEDLNHVITTLSATNIYTIAYPSDATNFTYESTSVPFLHNGTDIQYVTRGGTKTAITSNGRYVNYYIIATNAEQTINNQFRFVWIPGQQIYTSLQLAQGESIGSLDLTGLLIAEAVPVYRVTMRRESSYDAPANTRIESVYKIVGLSSAALSANQVNIHNTLADRGSSGAHPLSSIAGSVANAVHFTSSTDSSGSEVANFAYNSTTGVLSVPNITVATSMTVPSATIPTFHATTYNGMEWPTTTPSVSDTLVAASPTTLVWGAGGGAGGASMKSITHTNGTSIAISTLSTDLLQKIYVNMSASTDLSSTSPFGNTFPADGTQITLIGASTSTLGITTSDTVSGAITNGVMVVGLYDSITFMFDATLKRFVEIFRSKK